MQSKERGLLNRAVLFIKQILISLYAFTWFSIHQSLSAPGPREMSVMASDSVDALRRKAVALVFTSSDLSLPFPFNGFSQGQTFDCCSLRSSYIHTLSQTVLGVYPETIQPMTTESTENIMQLL